MKNTSETPQEIIGRLETELSRIVASRAEMILAIDARLKTAEQVIVDVNERPGPDKIQAGLEAHSEIQFLAKLRESIAEQYLANPMKMLRSRDRWLQDHHAELVSALRSILDEKSAGHEAFKEASADRQGKLTAAAVRAQGTPGEAAADDALAQAEGDLYDREQTLAVAKTHLRALQTDVTYAGWQRARQAVSQVNWELPEAHEKEK